MTATLTQRRAKPKKPRKPRKDFPLFPHQNGQWAKKVRQQTHYFGPWSDPQGGLDRYLADREDLHAGRTPQVPRDGLTVCDLANQFLTSKKHLLDSGELSPRTFADYHRIAALVVDAFGKKRLVEDLLASDFEQLRTVLAATRGPASLGDQVVKIRGIFKYAVDEGLIDRPVRYGQGFRRPSAKTLRKARAANGERMLEPDELRLILAEASPQMRAFTLLGLNCGYGQSDISRLPLGTVKKAIASGWLCHPREKTGVERRCPLWPETIEAIAMALDMRPKPRDPADSGLAFLTSYGRCWVRTCKSGDCNDSLGPTFRELLQRLGLKKPRIGFYTLRHVFQTIADRCKDRTAVNYVMGHIDSSMSAHYRERIDDSRLRAATDEVHNWLFGE